MAISESKKKQPACLKFRELLYEFYTQALMQNNFSFLLWMICYITNFLQLLDYIFHSYYEEVAKESVASSLILDILKYTSVYSFLF